MAKFREYGYYPKGNKIAIVEKDQVIDTEVSTTDINAFKRNTGLWKSPLETVADALQIEYAYNPKYFIKATDTVHSTITHYRSADGYFQIKGGAVNYDDTTNVDDYFLLRNAGEFNGLHRIKAYSDADGTNDQITTYTKYSGLTSTSTAFEETVTMYYALDVLNDEEDNLNIPPYLELAVVDYVKAKLAQDALQVEVHDYFMKEFRKKLEQHESSRIYGPRMTVAGSHSIR
jgi:hypothetical protein